MSGSTRMVRLSKKPRVIEVNSGHVLHRFSRIDPPFVCGETFFTSINQMYHSVMLAQHNLFHEVTELWKAKPRVDLHPEDIRGVVEGYFESRNITPSAEWWFNSYSAMLAVLFALLDDRDSSIRDVFRNIYRDHKSDVRFVETTHSDIERTWSSGHRPTTNSSSLPDDPDEYAGYNLYGEALTELYLYWSLRQSRDHIEALPSFRAMITKRVFQLPSFQKTAVIVSDSTFRHVRGVKQGDVWYRSGATFGELAQMIKAKHGNLAAFKFVVIAAGTNDATKFDNESDYDLSWQMMVQTLLTNLKNHPQTVVLMNTSIGISGNPRSRKYNKWFRAAFLSEFRHCSNFFLFDWSTPQPGNFFLHSDGEPRTRFLDHSKPKQPFHPSVSGTRRMWVSMSRSVNPHHFGDLRSIELKTTSMKYPVPQIDERVSLA